MALAFGAVVLNGIREKVCTVTCLDNDGADSLAVDYTTEGMTDHLGTPNENHHVVTAHGSDNVVQFAITASTATGFTLSKITAGGGGATMTVLVITRLARGIAL